MKKMILMLFLGSCSLFANENMHFSSMQSFDQRVSSEVADEAQRIIAQNIINDKYYVSPGSVYVGTLGIFVDIARIFVQVNHLGQDDQGVYVPADELNRTVYCGKCGLPYNPRFVHKCPKKG